MFVDNLNQLFETFNIFIVINTIALSPACPKRIIDGRRLYNEQPNPASCHPFVEGLDLLSHVDVVLVPHEHTCTGFYDPLPGFYRPNIPRFKQLLESHVATHLLPPPFWLISEHLPLLWVGNQWLRSMHR